MITDNITIMLKLYYWIDTDTHTYGVFTHGSGFDEVIGHYVVVRCTADNDIVPDVTYRMTGKLEPNPGNRAGYLQCDHMLTVHSYTPILDDISAVQTYISSLHGIGPKKAQLICESLGVLAIDKIKHDHKVLTDIRGISDKTALSIKDQIYDYEKFRRFLDFMLPYGMDGDFVSKAYAYRRKISVDGDPISYYTNYPYHLMWVDGADFELVDRMAMALGVDRRHPHRMTAAGNEVIKRAGRHGHTAVLYDDFAAAFAYLTGETISMSDIKACGCVAIRIKDSSTGGASIYIETSRQYKYEMETVSKLVDIISNTKPIMSGVTTDDIHARHMHLDAEQAIAVHHALTMSVSCITGGPGTGKTTVIKSIIREYNAAGYNNIILLAPTGKAARRMEESTGYRAMTIHRGMRFRPDEDRDTIDTDIDADLIIVDEMSMVDFANFSKLIKKVRHARFVFVGDIDQLSSVGAGCVFRDLLIAIQNVSSDGYTHTGETILHHNHRQGKGSTIAANAAKIRECDPSIVADDTFCFDWHNDDVEIAQAVVRTYMDAVRVYGVDGIAVLSPVKNGVAGVYEYNRVIQQYINPGAADKPQMVHHGETFRIGDIVMQTVNAEFTVNGDIGTVIDIDVKEGIVTVEFTDNRVIPYTKGQLADLTLAYAMTVHKSQGSEYRYVIYSSPKELHPGMCVKNIPYTAFTRAKEKVTYIGSWDTLCTSIVTSNPNRRQSIFGCMLAAYIRKTYHR